MATWTDLSAAFGYGTQLTSSQMQQLRDNVTAQAEGASGAPKHEMASVENFGLVFDHWSYNGNDDTVLAYNFASFSDVYVGYFKCPENPSYIAAAINYRASDAAGDARVRMTIDADSQVSSYGQNLNDTYAWHFTDGLDISSFGVGSMYDFTIQAEEDNGGGSYECQIRHIIIYNVNSVGY